MEQNACPQIVKPPLDQKALLVQEQVIYLQDVYKMPEAFSNTYRKNAIKVYFNYLLWKTIPNNSHTN
jgi:hypothetical protein